MRRWFSSVGLWGLLSATSDGGLLTNLVTNQANAPGGSQLSFLKDNLRAMAKSPITWMTLILLALAAVSALRGGLNRVVEQLHGGPAGDQRVRAITLLAGYLCLAAALSFATASRVGSTNNYFIEPLAVASLLVGLAGTRALMLTTDRRRAAAILLLCGGAVLVGAHEANRERHRWQARPYFDEIVASVRRLPPTAGPVFSTYPVLVEKADRTSYVNDFLAVRRSQCRSQAGV